MYPSYMFLLHTWRTFFCNEFKLVLWHGYCYFSETSFGHAYCKENTSMADIAFFGLGTMGLPMALNLLKAGHCLHVMPFRGIMEGPREVERLGGVIHDNLEGMLEKAEFIISVVPNDDSVRDIYLNETMKNAVRPGSIIIEMTSCSPEVVQEVEAYYADKNVGVIDAPITGALPKAIDGTLTIMGAGRAEDFQRAEAVFAPMAEKVFQLGKVGNGKLIKSMTNLLGAVNLAAVGEFYRFASAMGLNMEELAEVVKKSAGGSTQFDRNFFKMVEDNYKPTFTLALLRKDMGIALQSAEKHPELALPLSRLAYELYRQASDYDRDDCSSIARLKNV